MARSRLRESAAPLRRWQVHPRGSGRDAGPVQSESGEVRSVVEGLSAPEHCLDASDAGGYALVRSGPQDYRGIRSRAIIAWRVRCKRRQPCLAAAFTWHLLQLPLLSKAMPPGA